MTLEIALIATIVSAQVSNRVITFGASVKDVLGMMGETGKVAAVFMRQNRLDMCAFAGGVDLKGIIGASSDQKLTLFIEVERCDVGIGLGEFEQLRTFRSLFLGKAPLKGQITLVGLSVPMMSLVFSVLSPFGTSAGGGSLGGGGGGGGGPGAIIAALTSRKAVEIEIGFRFVHSGATTGSSQTKRGLFNDRQVQRALAGWPVHLPRGSRSVEILARARDLIHQLQIILTASLFVCLEGKYREDVPQSPWHSKMIC